MKPPSTDQKLTALLGLLPEIRDRHDIGFDAESREDALMESIVRLMERERRLELTHGTDVESIGRGYAVRIVRNHLIDRFRAAQTFTKNIEHCHGFDRVQDESKYFPRRGTNQFKEITSQLLSSLHQKDRDLLLSYFTGAEEYTQEIKRQNLRRGTARVRIHRLTKRLRKHGLRLAGAELKREV